MTLITSISGIRGTIGGVPGEAFTPDDIVQFTAAYASWLISNKQIPRIVIGRDGRISGPWVSKIVSSTLMAMGFEVLDLELSTTPTVEMAVIEEKAGGGIIITASHNPKQWNALKFLNYNGEFISEEEGNDILEAAKNRTYRYTSIDKIGKYRRTRKHLSNHIEKILALDLVDTAAIKNAGFCIVVDGVNSTGSIAVPELLKALGVDNVKLINDVVNGKFAHNPEPLPENLTGLSSEVKMQKASMGIAVDPDVDRLAFICDNGEPFGEEYTLVAVADYVLQHKKGNTVSNLSSTQALRDITRKYGGTHIASAVGEVNVVHAMKENQAVIGGEGNGGVIYPELHYGRDALVGIALFLSYLAKTGKSISQLRNKYPSYYITKKKTDLDKTVDLDLVLQKIKEKYARYPIIDIDGIKIEFDGDWVHLRKSNTESIIRIYAESKSETTSENLAKKLMSDIRDLL
jgi:phosphomannomutase